METLPKSSTGQNLRAAIFGVNDGLVSNSALIFGMTTAAAGSSDLVLISGVAGMLAGAFSMAAGEYISVRSQREFIEYQIGLEAKELRVAPNQLSSPYQAAFYSFISFALGALCPLLPFLIYDGSKALKWAAVLSALALMSIGIVISLYTGKGAVRSALRMLAIGAAACFITYLAGWALNFILPMRAIGAASSLGV